MTDVTPLPGHGEVFVDDRGKERALRVSWHQEADVAIFSFWRDVFCVGTFRLQAEDVPAVMSILARGPHRLREASDQADQAGRQTAPADAPLPPPQTGDHQAPGSAVATPAPAPDRVPQPVGDVANGNGGGHLDNPDDFPTEVWNGAELRRRLQAEARSSNGGPG